MQNAITTRESERNISVITQFKGKKGKPSVILEVDVIHKDLSIKRKNYQ